MKFIPEMLLVIILQPYRNYQFKTYIPAHIEDSHPSGGIINGSVFQAAQVALVGNIRQIGSINKNGKQLVFIPKNIRSYSGIQ